SLPPHTCSHSSSPPSHAIATTGTARGGPHCRPAWSPCVRAGPALQPPPVEHSLRPPGSARSMPSAGAAAAAARECQGGRPEAADVSRRRAQCGGARRHPRARAANCRRFGFPIAGVPPALGLSRARSRARRPRSRARRPRSAVLRACRLPARRRGGGAGGRAAGARGGPPGGETFQHSAAPAIPTQKVKPIRDRCFCCVPGCCLVLRQGSPCWLHGSSSPAQVGQGQVRVDEPS
ncbi:unnamed protein product, partial [Prorocentrum cordatum]